MTVRQWILRPNKSKSMIESVHRKGFEPLTHRFVVWCSIQLSSRWGGARDNRVKRFGRTGVGVTIKVFGAGEVDPFPPLMWDAQAAGAEEIP